MNTVRRIRLLTAATITYNVVEAVVATASGTVAGSVALIGFGLDSVVEITSAAAVAWQFAGADPQRRERTALRVVAWSFFALAAVVTLDALRTLVTGVEPGHSTVGIALVAVSVLVMPLLSRAQRRAGQALGSASAVADSRQTLLCTYLSAAVLVGLVLNSALGWWWADPLAALGLAVVAVREGRQALRGDVCCAPVVPDACTLPQAEQPLRLAEFDALFATAVAPAQRPSPTELRLHLPAVEADTARHLAARETACCSFFSFDVVASGSGSEMRVRVPQAQTGVLDAVQRRADALTAAPLQEP